MALIVRDKQRIFFHQESKKGPFLTLYHGLWGSHQDWYESGYVEALLQHFQLLLIDARGHGRSDKSTSPADYQLDKLAQDLEHVMKELSIRYTYFLGYSLGALVGYRFSQLFPHRLHTSLFCGLSQPCSWLREKSLAQLAVLGNKKPQQPTHKASDLPFFSENAFPQEEGRKNWQEDPLHLLYSPNPKHPPALKIEEAFLQAMSKWQPNTTPVQGKNFFALYGKESPKAFVEACPEEPHLLSSPKDQDGPWKEKKELMPLVQQVFFHEKKEQPKESPVKQPPYSESAPPKKPHS